MRRIRRAAKASPNRPTIIIAQVDGSGTAPATVPTVKPYQFSEVGLFQLIEDTVPRNWIVPFPSTPKTVLPIEVIVEPPYSLLGPPLWMLKAVGHMGTVQPRGR